MKSKNIFLVSAFCFCISCSIFAQTSQPNSQATKILPDREICKTKVTQEAIDLESQRDQAAYRQLLQQQMPESNVVTEYTVQIHIVRMDDGTGGINVNTIRNEITNWVNPYFAAVNASFVECGPENYINSSAYYNLSGDVEGDAMSVANNVANVINIYFVNDPDGACGWARFPWMLPSDYVVIANDCADNQSTIVHELGHYFALYHTHETAFGAEAVTRNNADACYDCDSQGDLFCDTPADPTLNLGSVSISAAPGCAYSSSLNDSCGVAYTPDPTLIMSYSLKECRTVFTASQKAKMTLTMASAPGSPLFGRNYLQTACPCDPPQAICKNISVNLNSSGNVTIATSDVDDGSTFDCGFGSWYVNDSTFNCSDVGNRIITLTLTDDNGSISTCQSTVTVVDATSPQLITSADNLTVQCDGSGNVTDFANWLSSHAGAVASDACGGSWSDNSTAFTYGCGGTGTQGVTFTFTDPSGNSVSTSATFTIEDKVDPSVTCPDNIHLPECVETATWTVVASDLCGNVTVVSNPPSGSSFAKGSINVVNVTVTDECGNESVCSFFVVRDTDLSVSIASLPNSSLNTCALGTSANIVLGYGGGPGCLTFNAIASGGHGPYTYSWAAPAVVPAGKFTNSSTSSPTFCADFQTVPCATYTFVVTATDIHGCTETSEVDVSVVNPLCTTSKNPKVGVCHAPPGNPTNTSSLCISSNAVSTHLTGHPDCLGDCGAVCVFYTARMINPVTMDQDLEKPYHVSVQPNPFNSSTVIKLTAKNSVKAQLTIVDYSGRILSTIFDGSLQNDVPYYIEFDAGKLQSGMYIARLVCDDGFVTHTTMVVAR